MPNSSQANNSDFENDLTLWPIFEFEFPLYKDKLTGNFTVQPIITNNISELNPLQLRSIVNYHPKDNLEFSLAYDFNKAYLGNSDFEEQRIFEQLTYTKSLKDLEFENRFRVEQRFINENDAAVRLRYRLRVSHPINSKKDLHAIVRNELHFFANSTPGLPAGFYENRFFVGLEKEFNKFVSWEGGYQLSARARPSPRRDLLRHSIITQFSFKLPY
ncbi:MAG: DUF2490 domain-containing protein [Candidatus Caenarcaniphilales bacterium]|nr:DUF2490 domain-containing protein [Candidatus Caenarcaniphilales bacterium]